MMSCVRLIIKDDKRLVVIVSGEQFLGEEVQPAHHFCLPQFGRA